MKTKQVYIAFDGREFYSPDECTNYENSHTLVRLINENFPKESLNLKLELCEFMYRNKHIIQEALFNLNSRTVEFTESEPETSEAIDIFSGDYDDKEEKHAII